MDMIRERGRFSWIKCYRDGRAFEESSRSHKEADARRLLRLRVGAIEQGVPITPRVGWIRFDEAAADLVNDCQVNAGRSLDGAERRIRKHLLPFFRGRRLSSITTSGVRTFVAARQAVGASNGEINRELTTLNRAGQFYMNDRDPRSRVRSKKTGSGR